MRARHIHNRPNPIVTALGLLAVLAVNAALLFGVVFIIATALRLASQ